MWPKKKTRHEDKYSWYGLKHEKPQDPPKQRKHRNRHGLFSDGFFGLLNKGPLGWILFGLLSGMAAGAYKALMAWAEK